MLTRVVLPPGVPTAGEPDVDVAGETVGSPHKVTTVIISAK